MTERILRLFAFWCENIRKQTEICSWVQGVAWLPHFTVQSLNINKGQLEPGKKSDAVPDLDRGFSFLFLSVSQRSDNHLQECGMFQHEHFIWLCINGVNALIPAFCISRSNLLFGIFEKQ